MKLSTGLLFGLAALSGAAVAEDLCANIADGSCSYFDFGGDSLVGTTYNQAGTDGDWSHKDGKLVEGSNKGEGSRCDVGSKGTMHIFESAIGAPSTEPFRTYQARVKVQSADGTVGLVFQYRDENNYSLLRFGEACMRTVRVRDGEETQLAVGTVSLEPRLWYTVTIAEHNNVFMSVEFVNENSGSALTQNFNYQTEEDFENNANAGAFGVYCRKGKDCKFDDVAVVETAVRGDLLQANEAKCAPCVHTWPVGTQNWCRCCGLKSCGYDFDSCVNNDGFCSTTCQNSEFCYETEENGSFKIGENNLPVPIDTTTTVDDECKVTAWNGWGPCSAPCDDGVTTPTQSRARAIISGKCEGTHLSESRSCNENKPCSVNQSPAQLEETCNCASCSISSHAVGSASWCRCCKAAQNPACKTATPACGNSVFEADGCLAAGYGSSVCAAGQGGDTPAGETPDGPPSGGEPTSDGEPVDGKTSDGDGDQKGSDGGDTPVGTVYSACNCVSCQYDYHPPGGEAWCRCCSMAMIPQCDGNSRCQSNVFAPEGCNAQNYEQRCGALQVANLAEGEDGQAVDGDDASSTDDTSSTVLTVMIVALVVALLSLLTSLVISCVLYSRIQEQATVEPPPLTRRSSSSYGGRSSRRQTSQL